MLVCGPLTGCAPTCLSVAQSQTAPNFQPACVTRSAEVANCRCFSRVTAPNGCGSEAFAAKGTPRFRPPRLGPRPYTSSAVNSFGGCFVWVLWLAHQVWSVVAATPLADSTQSDHESPNAPAIARSVYVIAHTTALPARLGPRFWVVTNNICR